MFVAFNIFNVLVVVMLTCLKRYILLWSPLPLLATVIISQTDGHHNCSWSSWLVLHWLCYHHNSNNLPTPGWNGKSWVAHTVHIVPKQRNTWSFVPQPYPPIQWWISYQNSMLIHCYKIFMLYYFHHVNWTLQWRWSYRCQCGRSGSSIFRAQPWKMPIWQELGN